MTYEEYAAMRNAGKSDKDIAAYEAQQKDRAKKEKAKAEEEERNRRLSTPGGESKHSSFDQLPFEEQYALTAAIYGGSPSNNKYLSSAMKTYKMLEGEARTIAEANNIKPDDPQYQKFIDTYLDGMYNDNFVSLDDVRSAMTNASNKNDETYEASRANRQYEADRARSAQNAPSAGLGGGVAANVGRVDAANAHQSAAAREQSSAWSPTYGSYPMSPGSPMPSIPNSGDPTLPYMNYGTEETGYKPYW